MGTNDGNRENLKNVRFILGIVAGKGGVGKSTVAAELARTYRKQGLEVGILDGDIYGPSIRESFPEESLPTTRDSMVVPARSGGIALMSVAYFHKGKGASVIRAPIANQIILQFLHEIEWGTLDLLIVDFPPGTGDVQITLMQQAPFSGVVIITTPHELSLLDARKSAQMSLQMGVPLLGVIENMSYFIDPNSGEHHALFGEGGGQKLADEFHIPLLSQVPIDPALQQKALFEEAAEKILNELKNEKIDEIKREDLYHFSIHWLDGKRSLFRASDVQRHCPCVKCSADRKNLMVDFETEIKQITRVGRFGLQLVFNKGCSQGIYPFSLLRGIDR
ncbi:MAG: Iron-sulfur cluster carrier protein [Chlamydiae bacterium]|nr:Iron-sulfur cluster carrier protein [Chlamydiota bacterium]